MEVGGGSQANSQRSGGGGRGILLFFRGEESVCGKKEETEGVKGGEGWVGVVGQRAAVGPVSQCAPMATGDHDDDGGQCCCAWGDCGG